MQLKISPGWHVNANPASLDFLIPTRVETLRPGSEVEVVYPAGSLYQPRFSLEALSIYQGEVDIPVRSAAPLPTGEKLRLTFQACDETTCLPPETLELAVP